MGIKRWFQRKGKQQAEGIETATIVILGSPNVGKSVLFHKLTGRYVTVSNYPGTTVEITRGAMRYRGRTYKVIDSPGMYSFNPITDEERISRRLLLQQKPELALHVVDARNVDRMLPLTLQLIEAGLPVILVLNMIDELERDGLRLEINALRQRLNVPIVATACHNGRGIQELKEQIHAYLAR